MESIDFEAIVNKANSYLLDNDITDFSLIGINWDKELKQWLVTFDSDYGTNECINIWICFVNSKPHISQTCLENIITIGSYF